MSNDELVAVDGVLIHTTELAYLVNITGKEEWVTRSLCIDVEINSNDRHIGFDMKQWQAEERGWV